MPVKDRQKYNEYMKQFMKPYRQKERAIIRDWRRINHVEDGRKKKK